MSGFARAISVDGLVENNLQIGTMKLLVVKEST